MKNKNIGSNLGLILAAGTMVVGKLVADKELDIFGIFIAGWAGSVAGSIIQDGFEDIIAAIEED